MGIKKVLSNTSSCIGCHYSRTGYDCPTIATRAKGCMPFHENARMYHFIELPDMCKKQREFNQLCIDTFPMEFISEVVLTL